MKQLTVLCLASGGVGGELVRQLDDFGSEQSRGLREILQTRFSDAVIEYSDLIELPALD